MDKIITIDGPSGVGKGTASRFVANALSWRWLDSGALYRLVAHCALQQEVGFNDIPALVDIANGLNVEFSLDAESDDPDISLDGVVVNNAIRREECGKAASLISAHPAVRVALLSRQRDFATGVGLVADGRDMGTVVFEKAPVKIFLTASAAVRAERRRKQLLRQGVGVNMRSLLQEIEQRDKRDSSRSVCPLKPAEDAVIIDTSNLSAQQVGEQILKIASKVFAAEVAKQ